MEKQEILANLHYMPVLLFVMLSTTFILTYVIAVLLGHVKAGFPYISDAATHVPESCIFSQFINMTAALMCLVVYIRYSQIKECSRTYELHQSLPRWNRVALITGLISTLGLSMVANFQVTSVIVVHLIGALLCVGGGTAYFWTQAMCSYYLHPLGCTTRMLHIRLILSTVCTVCFFIIFITGILARMEFTGSNPRNWNKEDGGWEFHVVSTVTEWICAIIFCAYILTFTDEFKEIQLIHPKVLYKPGRLKISSEILNEGQHFDPQPQNPPTTT